MGQPGLVACKDKYGYMRSMDRNVDDAYRLKIWIVNRFPSIVGHDLKQGTLQFNVPSILRSCNPRNLQENPLGGIK